MTLLGNIKTRSSHRELPVVDEEYYHLYDERIGNIFQTRLRSYPAFYQEPSNSNTTHRIPHPPLAAAITVFFFKLNNNGDKT